MMKGFMLLTCLILSLSLVTGCGDDEETTINPPAASPLSGMATDASHAAVSSATAVLVPAGDVESSDSVQVLEDLAAQASGQGYPVATTDANGGFSFSGVSDGDYFLVLLPSDARHLPGAINEAITVSGGATADSLDMTISQVPSSAATYIGSAACLACHPKSGPMKTLHFLGFRAPGATNSLQDLSDFPDADRGLAEFTAAGQCISFPAKGATHYAFIQRVGSDYNMQMADDDACTIRSATYKVAFSYGGEGVYKQRYMMLVGPDGGPGTEHVGGGGDAYYYPAPFQWNESNASGTYPPAFGENGEFSGKWIPPVVNGDNVFAPDGQSPGEAPEESFGVDCGGCHGGVRITKDGSDNFITQYIDQVAPGVYAGNIGCERCHGPGSEHQAAGGNGESIVVPEYLTPGRAIVVCGTCHQRGHGESILSGSAHAGFASTGNLDTDPEITVFKPGMGAADFFGTSNGSGIQPVFGTSGGFWQAINYDTDTSHAWQDDALPSFPTEFNHSKGHHQQYMDVVRTVMNRNDREIMVCFSCHDAHGSDHEHQLRFDADNNAQCLECHNGSEVGKGGFEPITRAMVDELQASGTSDPVIGASVEDHMETFADMSGTYDPEGTGFGRCVKCHMPKTAKTARWNATFPNGYREGDVHSHTFDVMSKESVNDMFADRGNDPLNVTPAGYTNACGICHIPNLP